MNSERNIIKRLFESRDLDDKDLDERTYTVGDTQYWRRGGKCYSWTADGGRVECSEDEYLNAISGGSVGGSVKNTEPKDDKATEDKPETAPAKKSIDFSSLTTNVNDMPGDRVSYSGEGLSRSEKMKFNKAVKGIIDNTPGDYSNFGPYKPGSKIGEFGDKDGNKYTIISKGSDYTVITSKPKSDTSKEDSKPAKSKSAEVSTISDDDKDMVEKNMKEDGYPYLEGQFKFNDIVGGDPDKAIELLKRMESIGTYAYEKYGNDDHKLGGLVTDAKRLINHADVKWSSNPRTSKLYPQAEKIVNKMSKTFKPKSKK